MRRSFAAALAGVALAAGCGGIEPVYQGTHSGTVSGPVTGSFAGKATFSVDAEGWSLGMSPARPPGWFLLFLGTPGGRPAAGSTIELVWPAPPRPDPPHAYGRLDDYFGAGGTVLWWTRSGAIRVTASSPERLVGTFEFTAGPMGEEGTQGDITVTGTFEAVCHPLGSC